MKTKTIKYAYKCCMLNDLPPCYRKRLELSFTVKKDDFPKVLKIGKYAFTIWTVDLPIERTLIKNLP